MQYFYHASYCLLDQDLIENRGSCSVMRGKKIVSHELFSEMLEDLKKDIEHQLKRKIKDFTITSFSFLHEIPDAE